MITTINFINTFAAYNNPKINTTTEIIPTSVSPRISDEKVIKELNKNQMRQEMKRLEDENTLLNIELETIKDKNEESENLLEQLKEELKAKETQIQELSRIVTYDSNDLGSVSNTTYSHMKRALKGTSMESLAEAFVDAEKTHSVNAFFLAGLVANESSWATSPRAINQNNLTGHDVPSDGSVGTYFSSKEESIMQAGKEIRNCYLNPDGEFYNGISLQAVNKKYSQIAKDVPNPEWYRVINQIANDLVAKANNF